MGVGQAVAHYPDYDRICFWIFVMLGRYLFPLDSSRYDDWQKLLCLFGNAGTGKASFTNHAKVDPSRLLQITLP